MANKTYSVFLVLTFIAIVNYHYALAKSSRHNNNSNNSNNNNEVSGGRRSRNRHSRNHESSRHRCPGMPCSPVSPTCQKIEYIVLEYVTIDQHSGREIRFDCQSCDFCQDVELRNVHKREAIFHGMKQQRVYKSSPKDCPGLVCPVLPKGCLDIRPTKVSLSGKYCRTCPACYDNVLLTIVSSDR